MRLRYEYWRHKALGETYAVRVEDGRVTGVAGPLDGGALDRDALPRFDYDGDPDRCRDLDGRGGEFLLVKR